MAFLTLKEIEAQIQAVFPAAVLYEPEDSRIEPPTTNDVEPGHWIDDLQEILEWEKDDLERLEWSRRGGRAVAVALWVSEGMDTRGFRAFVPVDYADRYGAPQWPGADMLGMLGDAYDPPPIDNVPPDDIINIDWATSVIDRLLPHADWFEYEGGRGLGLSLFLVSTERNDKGQEVFDTSIEPTEFGVQIDLELDSPEDVWEWEASRVFVKEKVDAIPVDLTISEQLRLIAELFLTDSPEWAVEALRNAESMLLSPARKQLAVAVAEGESKTVEFKLTARSNFGDGDRSEAAERALIKTVAGMMNGDGGVLLVGVDDHGQVRGLDSDLLRVKGSHDKLLLAVTQGLEAALGTDNVAFCVTGSFEELDNKTALVIRVYPSSRPVFARFGNEEVFYVRSGPSTKQLKPSEFQRYIDGRWGRGASALG